MGSSFQFCSPKVGHQSHGFLFIGDGAMPVAGRDGFVSVPFLNRGLPGRYHADVIDFHVNGISVDIPSRAFYFVGRNDGRGGFAILVTGAYKQVFSRRKLFPGKKYIYMILKKIHEEKISRLVSESGSCNKCHH
ncbi:hypothetical protein Mapa_005744 [Marchantia paleacea]|nr:hypothetical protein Mapa_005744 [Marchantia paleacea]